MNAAFIPTRIRITTDRYQKMVATGVLTKYDRVELIEGEILDKAPIGPKHAAVTSRLTRYRPRPSRISRSLWTRYLC